MAGINRIILATLLRVALFAGCSGSDSSNATATASADGSQPAAQTDPTSNPIARAASEWLDAVLKGDKQRASARLTPLAQQQITKNNMEFSPPGGIQTASFRIGEVRTPSQDQAIVQCVLNFSANGQQQSEESCCLLRFVDNEWRVAGIAYGTASDKPWTLTNFETGQDVPIPRQSMSVAGSTAADASGASGRPSPPRTAQETAAAIPTVERR
jgi:hypothetical protein